MRQDRPPLRARLATVDARLRRPDAIRSIATLAAALLLVEGAVLLDRGTRGAPTSVEVAAAAGVSTADAALAADPLAIRGAPDATTAPVATADAAATDVTTAPVATADAAATAAAAPSVSARDSRPSVEVARPAAAPPPDPARQRFEQRYPAHARARQNVRDPRTTRWAVLIGVNEHSGRTRDNLGSRQDAEDLYRHLVSLGWAEDRIVLLRDGAATRENIVQALRWLSRKTDGDSVAVVHYSGHTKQWHGRDADGDAEVPDEAMWPSDNRFITDREVGELLSQVRAGRLWFNVGACEAAGFDDWGTTGPNRIVTWSSGEHQKSYEDPGRGNSVWGFHLVEEGLLARHADANGDGNVTVEEAFRFAAPRAHQRTRTQRPHGPQTPQVSDRYPGEFDLRIPPKPRPAPSRSEPTSEEEHRCLLCPPTRAPAHLRLR